MTFSGMPRVMTEQVYAKFHGYSPRLRRVMALSFVRGEKKKKQKMPGEKLNSNIHCDISNTGSFSVLNPFLESKLTFNRYLNISLTFRMVLLKKGISSLRMMMMVTAW